MTLATPLLTRLSRLSPEGRIAWHVEAAVRRRVLVSVASGRMAA